MLAPLSSAEVTSASKFCRLTQISYFRAGQPWTARALVTRSDQGPL